MHGEGAGRRGEGASEEMSSGAGEMIGEVGGFALFGMCPQYAYERYNHNDACNRFARRTTTRLPSRGYSARF